jgi:hypothetical protein
MVHNAKYPNFLQSDGCYHVFFLSKTGSIMQLRINFVNGDVGTRRLADLKRSSQ